MHTCTGDTGTCPGCRSEAAKVISDWGYEGVETATRIVGGDVANRMFEAHIRSNTTVKTTARSKKKCSK